MEEQEQPLSQSQKLPTTTSITGSSPADELSLDEDEAEEIMKLVRSLPKEKCWNVDGVCQYQGFWCLTALVPCIISFQRHFQPQDQDIILASKPKSGTTWLKALAFSIVNRTRCTLSNTPLLASNPHQLIPFFEFNMYQNNKLPNLTTIPSPRLFSTHIPYPSLLEAIKNKRSNCRIVYMCRNIMDVMVSYWHFVTKIAGSRLRAEWSFEDHFESFCQGKEPFGPFWNHVLGYWKASLERPNQVLFLMYEDVKKDTVSHVKRLAEFLGFPFSAEEEKDGVVEEIVNICSFSNLKELEVNKSGQFQPFYKNKDYFRKGEVGDWVNYFTPSMAERIEKIMQEKLSGSGLTFNVSG